MSRSLSLSALSALFVLAAGFVAVGGSTPDAAAGGAGTPPPTASYQVVIRHDDGSEETLSARTWIQEVVVPRDAASGLPTGKRQHKPFVITKELDKSSPILMKACATGEHFPRLQLDAFRTRNGRSELYLTITLEDVVITSYRTSGDAPTSPAASSAEYEEIAFVYQKIDWNFHDLGVVFEDDASGKS